MSGTAVASGAMPGPRNAQNRRAFYRGSLGTTFAAKKWLSLDPCGLAGVSVSWSVHLYALLVVASQLLSNSPIAILLFVFLYLPTAFLAMVSLFKAWTTNPGAVPMGARPLTIVRRASSASLSGGEPAAAALQQRRTVRRCHKCNDNYKPPRAHHDSVTGRCIVKFDHFCPWVGNAVGALNHKFFCLFLLYTALCCLQSIVLLILRAVHCGYMRHETEQEEEARAYTEGETYPKQPDEENGRRFLNDEMMVYKYKECNDFYSNHWVIGLALVSVVFFVFTCGMGCEQLEAIETGRGKIARMKMRVGNAGTEFSAVTEEFNEMFGGDTGPGMAWHWFWPFAPVSFPRSMSKVVLGFEYDPSFGCDEPYYDDSESSDQEMDEIENGRKKPPRDVSGINATASAEGDGLVKEDHCDVSSITSSGGDSTSSRVKNRKNPTTKSPPAVVSTPVERTKARLT